ncbi:MAG TPA: TIGR03618 family F420-dependent PPOX class oxidoreductase [Acidimicrobiia bacterium]|nr:TIGR03618 family F420-dependent PPOX class oxidoreductase [Acidimicrobiia bacterium]
MAQLSDFESVLASEGYLAVVATSRADGSVQASIASVGVLDHPVRGTPIVALVARGDALKVRHWRRDPRATLVAQSGYRWVTVEGTVELAGPDDRLDGVDPAGVPELLRAVFRAAGGTHDDWATYDRVMADERRVAVLVTPTRVYSNG